MSSVKQKIKKHLDSGNKLKNKNEFVSLHKLDFETAPWITYDFTRFIVGTCEGLYSYDGNAYQILSVVNSKLNNGHFRDVIEWFENSCKRDKKNFMFFELWNQRLKKYLIDKHGFVIVDGTNHLIKRFGK